MPHWRVPAERDFDEAVVLVLHEGHRFAIEGGIDQILIKVVGSFFSSRWHPAYTQAGSYVRRRCQGVETRDTCRDISIRGWRPQDMSRRIPHAANVKGDFYVEENCCTMCGVPFVEAPELFGIGTIRTGTSNATSNDNQVLLPRRTGWSERLNVLS